MTFIVLNNMPFDRVNSDYQLIHATGYAYVDDDGKLTICYEDDINGGIPTEGDKVFTEDEWNERVFGPEPEREEDFV